MHIGFLTSEFPHPKVAHSAGIGTSIFNLSKGLSALGHRVSVIVYGQASDEKLDCEGISLYLVKNRRIKGLSRFLTQKKIQKLIDKLVQNESLDLIEAADWTGITSNINPKCPVVVKLHGSDTYFCHLDGRPVKPINKFREKRALERAGSIVSVSAFTALVTKELFGLDRDIEVIPNGIDIGNFQPSDSSPKAGKVLYFGTLIRKKGLLELPPIFNKLIEMNPGATLELVGKDSADVRTSNPSTWEMMKPLFTPQALQKVVYSGAVEYSEMRQKIDQAEVCVFPTFAEALPVSWIETMAMGKAMVASNIGWAPEIVENHKQGYLVHPEAHAEFARCINALLSDKPLREAMGNEARKRAISEFANDVIAKKSAIFYERIIRGNSK